MPHFRLETNIPKNRVPAEFLKQTTALMAKTLGKPESYCVAAVIPDQAMVWGGTTEPCGTATLMSIGKLGVEENKKHAVVLYDHVEKYLGIPKNRLYITFIDENAANVGYNGTTFHEIFGGR
ncbi:macrophage migration inhibitory factor homolog [Anabrus simplex]|uniref:macrophage migration inhibitory factor homolog n=1 Tax=Anabrus simplex TaxID=316456 RepID=UPI0034DDC7F4